MTQRPVGFVGLGAIGRPMAQRLLAWPAGLWVYDVDPEAAGSLREAGAHVAESVTDLAARVGLMSVMVRDDDQVREVLDGALDARPSDLTVAVHSTVAPGTPAELGGQADAVGVRLLDAPVSGGPVGAAEGTLAIMVGGQERDLEQCRDALSLMGSRVVHAGPVGAGTAMKLARNLIHFVSFTAVTEAQRLAEAAGVDLQALGEVVRHTDAITGGPGAIMHRETAAPLASDDAWRPIFDHVRTLGEKDLRFAADLAEQLAVETPLARLAHERLGPGLGLIEED